MDFSLTGRDKESVWHPFTVQTDRRNCIPVVRAEGACFWDDKGNKYIDGIASWWVNVHGHSHPYIANAVYEQMLRCEHVLFSGYTHEPGVRLAERLKSMLPWMDKVFYSDDGSTAVEVGIKMALQHWSNKGEKRTKIIALENAYHGDTFGSMSVGARNVFSAAFERHLFEVTHIPVPVKGAESATLEKLSSCIDQDTAALIVEPLIQGAGGMIMYDADVLDRMIDLCHGKGIPVIADEVMTGFGRTGRMFASDHLLNKPDIIALSKGLTGGFMPLGATLCTAEIYSAFRTADKTKTFFHGHSYTGNPLACAAANASLDLFEKEETLQKIARIEKRFSELAGTWKGHDAVNEVRQMGAILAVELRTEENTGYLNSLAEDVLDFFPSRGVVLRPLGNVVYLLPPYCISEEELNILTSSLFDFLDKRK